MAKGGARKGAGRPAGSKNLLSIRDYMTEKDIETFFEFLMANYMEDSRLTVWLGDHLMGKAPQPIQGEVTGTLNITFDDSFISTPEGNK